MTIVNSLDFSFLFAIIISVTYKEDNEKDRITLFKYCLDLNMPERKKKKVFKYLYEEFRITHEMYKDIDEYIKGIRESDLRNFKVQLLD